MFRNTKFKVSQAVYNVRKSVMMIITLALAISMISGLFVYFDSYERGVLQSSSQYFDSVADLNLVHKETYQNLFCSGI